MTVFIPILLILVGVACLVVGADFFVDGASGIAKKMHISTFVIGMTIVALGTSAPELAVSFKSVLSNSGDVMMGNIIGSNIINILLVLGLSTVIRSINVNKDTVRIEVPFLIVISVIFVMFYSIGDKELSHLEGGVLVFLCAVYITYMVLVALKSRKAEKALPVSGNEKSTVTVQPVQERTKTDKPTKNNIYSRLKNKVWFLIIITIVGLAGVVGGAELVVSNINVLADMIENENARKILAVTIVALGTSLPELVTSVAAAVKGDVDLALGNVIGSNILNILLVGGLPTLFFSATYTTPYLVDGIVAIAAAVLILVCVAIGKGKRINRAGGIIMLAGLAGYLVYLFLA